MVESVLVKGNQCNAVVNGVNHGKNREKVMPELSRTDGKWVFENFHYRFQTLNWEPPEDGDLIHMIREYLGEIPYANH